MQKKSLLILMLVLFVKLAAIAGPRSFVQAQKIAENQASRLGIVIDRKARAKARAINGVDSHLKQVVDYYVFPNGADKGFTIVSGDDRMPEIVGYADSGTYDENQMTEGMAMFLDSYKAMAEAVKAGDPAALSLLNEHRAMTASPKRASAKVAPLLGQIQWNQGYPYNMMCPKYNGNDRSVTGCVATAIAQIMAFWKYPKKLMADIPAYTTRTNEISMPGISQGATYDWDNMLPRYVEGNYNNTQAEAVAKLMLHCGAAVEMDYGSSSGAVVNYYHLTKYFGYDVDLIANVFRANYSIAEWADLIDRELSAGRPILYGGFSSTSGHQFVCDGSNGSGLYHINWGWGGYQNGYFDITILNPKKGGAGSGNAPDGYNRNCDMIIGIQPDNGIVDEPLVFTPSLEINKYTSDKLNTYFNITKDTRANESEAFSLSFGDALFSTTTNPFNGKFAYAISDGKGGYTLICNPRNLSNLSGEFVETNFNFAPKNGTYTIYGVYCKKGETTWHKCLYTNGMKPITLIATTDKLTKANSLLSATITPAGKIVGLEKATFNVEVTNNGNEDYIGLITLHSGRNDQDYNNTPGGDCYISVPAHSTITRQITILVEVPEGDFYLRVKDDAGEEISAPQKITAEMTTKPVLVLTNVETNVTPGDYETENAFRFGNRVKAPKINDDYALFRYKFKNIGGAGKVQYFIYCEDASDGSKKYWKGGYKQIDVPNDGSELYVEETWSPAEVEFNFMMGGIEMSYIDNNLSPFMYVNMKNYMYNLVLVEDENRGYRVPANLQFVYVAGKPVGIDHVETTGGKAITGGEGEIIIRADKAETVAIYGIDGRLVHRVSTEAGDTKRVSVPAGIYIVKGAKVVVR